MYDTFGEYGHYRGDALKENAKKDVIYATKEACIDCHSDIAELIEAYDHGEISCLSCHGPGLEAHFCSLCPMQLCCIKCNRFCYL